MLRALVGALAAVYPKEVSDDPRSWPRARWLDALVLALVDGAAAPPIGTEARAASLLNRLAEYRYGALAAYAQVRPLFERALAIREKVLGLDHPQTAKSRKNLADLIKNRDEPA